ncbi:hypothetical protein HPP92_002380 [Vanilla planifolia]|uniref:Uncharacterized protein n=1 Tax=Vanilla planifolia TaxID=51239 RepID=A0A835SEK2_VANPL|nr:hypothetical protein HPP92_002380 [Vanilla planifolia]
MARAPEIPELSPVHLPDLPAVNFQIRYRERSSSVSSERRTIEAPSATRDAAQKQLSSYQARSQTGRNEADTPRRRSHHMLSWLNRPGPQATLASRPILMFQKRKTDLKKRPYPQTANLVRA